MKRILKVLSISFLVCFSFYYTEKIACIVQNKDDLMIHINKVKNDYNIEYVNAVISGDTIIPGINGVSVNAKKSYNNMKSFDVFNEYYLEYDQIKPVISLKDNKNKIIIKGNKNKKAVAIISKNNKIVSDYLKEQGYEDNTENICILEIDEKCKENNYKVKSSLIINHQNILTKKNEIQSGDIIIVEENVGISELKVLIEEINYRDLKIVSLNKLISEENNIY